MLLFSWRNWQTQRTWHRRRRCSLFFAPYRTSNEIRRLDGSSRAPSLRRFWSAKSTDCGNWSVRGDGEVDGDPGLGFDGFVALIVRLKMPLLDCLLRGAGQDRRTAYHAQTLNQAVAPDQRLQNHGTLHFHLARQHRIVRLYGTTEDLGSIGGHLHALGGGPGHILCASVDPVLRIRLRDFLRSRARLQIDPNGIRAGMNGSMNISGNYFDFERWKHGTCNCRRRTRRVGHRGWLGCSG